MFQTAGSANINFMLNVIRILGFSEDKVHERECLNGFLLIHEI